jgi:hypothetical protein
MKLIFSIAILLFLFGIFTGCTTSKIVTSTPENISNNSVSTIIPTEFPTSLPTLTISPEPTQAQNSNFPSIYKDEINGFEINYPDGWTLVPFEQIGTRGGQAQLYSPGSNAETLLPGGTRVYVLVYDWDPKNDLTAYVTQRKIAWEASGQKIITESNGILSDGRDEVRFIVETPEKAQTFSLFTTIGDKYLQIAGDGDLRLLEEIARTVRPVN